MIIFNISPTGNQLWPQARLRVLGLRVEWYIFGKGDTSSEQTFGGLTAQRLPFLTTPRLMSPNPKP